MTKSAFIGTALGLQWLRLCVPNAGVLGLTPGLATRSHRPQLRVQMLQINKILQAAVKIKDPACCHEDLV